MRDAAVRFRFCRRGFSAPPSNTRLIGMDTRTSIFLSLLSRLRSTWVIRAWYFFSDAPASYSYGWASMHCFDWRTTMAYRLRINMKIDMWRDDLSIICFRSRTSMLGQRPANASCNTKNMMIFYLIYYAKQFSMAFQIYNNYCYYMRAFYIATLPIAALGRKDQKGRRLRNKIVLVKFRRYSLRARFIDNIFSFWFTITTFHASNAGFHSWASLFRLFPPSSFRLTPSNFIFRRMARSPESFQGFTWRAVFSDTWAKSSAAARFYLIFTTCLRVTDIGLWWCVANAIWLGLIPPT